MNKKSQAGVEYMIIIGFVTVAIISTLALSYFYSNLTKDRIRQNQIEGFTLRLIDSAESVFFAGEPSEVTVDLYLPDRVVNYSIESNSIVVTTSATTGINVVSYRSRVPIQGFISPGEGVKVLKIKAESNYVSINQIT